MTYFPSVFVSSSDVPRDQVPDYRDAGRLAVLDSRMTPIMYEHYRMSYTGGSPKELSQEMIDVSDIFVGIYTREYGREMYDGKDWAEYEFDYAVSQSKPMLLFISRQPSFDDQFSQFQQKFSDQFYQVFGDASDLRTKITRLLDARFGHLANDRMNISPLFGAPKPHSQYEADLFMIMPFRPHLDTIYETCIKPTVASVGLTIKRGDNFFNNFSIMDDIWSATHHAKAVIADCTGQNANVFYEIGIAHTLGKQFILLTQDEKDIPFDLRQYRYYVYSPDKLDELEAFLRDALNLMNLKQNNSR